jgi:phage baseplate assembly protein W
MALKYPGVPYPITKNPKGFFFIQDGIDQVKADMLILLLTNPGERVMLPDYGTPLRRLIFEPNDPKLVLQTKNMIARSLKLWEPRVAITQIFVKNGLDKNSRNISDDGTEADGVLLIRVLFVDRAKIDEVFELKLEVPIAN